jgi:endonuclease/exonuclease/phosphatase family metal-dependent hydrolase
MRKLLGVAAAVAAFAAGVAPSANAAVTTRVWDMNISGHVLNSGRTGVADAVVRTANNYTADFVTLQEVCETQFDYIEAQPGYSGHFWPTLTQDEYRQQIEDGKRSADSKPLCGGTGSFGNAVFSRGGVGTLNEEEYVLPAHPDRPEEQPYMVCVRQNIRTTAVRARACSVHLSTHDATRQAQLEDVAYVVNVQASSGTRVIVGGDFNAEPGDLVGALGQRFIEADYFDNAATHENPSCPYATDQSRAAEHCQGPLARKIDHVFFSRNHVASGSVIGSPAGTSYSDHLPLRGTAGFN